MWLSVEVSQRVDGYPNNKFSNCKEKVIKNR